MNLFEDILFRSVMTPDRVAICFGRSQISYASLSRTILAIARSLRENNVRSGQICGIRTNNPIWALSITYALNHIGALGVNANLTEDFAIARIDIDYLIIDTAMPTLGNVKTIRIDQEWINGPIDDVSSFDRAPDTTTHICLTSGTTGLPKAIAFPSKAIRHRQMMMHFASSHIGWERAMCIPGVITSLGFVFSNFALASGKTLVYPTGDLSHTPEYCKQYNCDFMVASVNQASQIAARVSAAAGQKFEGIKGMLVGGGVVTRSFAEAIRTVITNEAIVMYGSTETGPVAYGPVKMMGDDDGWSGIVTPWASVQIVDEDNNPLPRGEEGRLRIASLGAAQPIHDVDRTSAEGPWHYPGDLARINKNLALIVTGRADSLINIGGVKISPEVLEREISEIMFVKDVAIVTFVNGLGVTDLKVGVAVDFNDRSDDVLEACKNIVKQRIHTFTGGVHYVDTIPRNSMGKIERSKLQEIF